MSDPRFLQDGYVARLAHLIEECGECVSAAGKTLRWGRLGANPLLPEEDRETNEAWLRREMADVEQAIVRLRETLDDE